MSKPCQIKNITDTEKNFTSSQKEEPMTFILFKDNSISGFDLFHPNTWFSFLFTITGIYLAVTLSWQCSFQYQLALRTLFAATAGFFNWGYVLVHFLFQTTACQLILK